MASGERGSAADTRAGDAIRGSVPLAIGADDPAEWRQTAGACPTFAMKRRRRGRLGLAATDRAGRSASDDRCPREQAEPVPPEAGISVVRLCTSDGEPVVVRLRR
ncbi:hypothetical protein JCM9534A_76560 [Catenuloplanes indicus JCM 9534]